MRILQLLRRKKSSDVKVTVTVNPIVETELDAMPVDWKNVASESEVEQGHYKKACADCPLDRTSP